MKLHLKILFLNWILGKIKWCKDIDMKSEHIAKLQLTLQGILNHFGFFFILSSSESIALSFDQK